MSGGSFRAACEATVGIACTRSGDCRQERILTGHHVHDGDRKVVGKIRRSPRHASQYSPRFVRSTPIEPQREFLM
ncbi:hypothetical protein [Flavilitoribacter nigricans]|uniref:hypothetical protein n=1 Tax=Flavilitoribacter nigricans TaxID=70997 RepID=UPI00117B0F20|nr:hypothetical protein [Flavilitoribacter nigricans]